MPGLFHFAWATAFETTFGPEHQVEDEEVFSFRVEHAEGEFASLSIEIRNPRIGLLASARKTWAWLSWNNGAEVVPLFFGRLIGVPGNLHQEIVTLQFTGRPADYNAQKEALAETLKVAPCWDPIWIDPDQRSDPDVVLEARSQLWHIDRVTHEVTISDVLVGEEGIEEFVESDVFYDSVAVRLNQPPLRTVSVDGQVHWTQGASGSLDVIAGSAFDTFTGDGLIQDWPKAGSNIGGGWEVASASATDVYGIGKIADDAYENAAQQEGFANKVENGRLVPQAMPSGWLWFETLRWSFFTADLREGVLVPLWRIATTLRLRYATERQRSERVRFTLSADVQPIVTLPGEDEVQALILSSTDVGEPIDGELPIGDVRRRSYFPTERGLRSLEYLVALARAHLLMRSRAVEIEFSCRFERAIALSCRKNARVFDRRLPGGQAVGKIISYAFSVDGATGTMIGSATIGCAVGYSGAISELEGDPTYVDDDYVENDYQARQGHLVVLGPGDVGYSVPIDAVDDDGLDLLGGLRREDVISNYAVVNGAQAQAGAAGTGMAISSVAKDVAESIKNALKDVPTKLEFTLKPVTGGPFESVYDIDVSVLKVPAMINLEAAS
jgi:hypothetical protein